MGRYPSGYPGASSNPSHCARTPGALRLRGFVMSSGRAGYVMRSALCVLDLEIHMDYNGGKVKEPSLLFSDAKKG